MIICWPEDMHPDNCGGDCDKCKEEEKDETDTIGASTGF